MLEIHANIKNNALIPPGLPRDTTVCIVDAIKVTDLVVEGIRKKTNHKE